MDSVALAEQELDTGVPIRDLANDSIIIELLQTLNHLSRWLTPIHDRTLLEFSPHRAQPSVKDLLLQLRDRETRVYSYMLAIATQDNPDLDRIPPTTPSPLQLAADKKADPLVTMSEFRRLRQSSTSLLRALPDNAWARAGHSRRERNWTIRDLAEFLVAHDRRTLREIDRVLARSGARAGIAEVSQVSVDEIDKPFVSSIHHN
jgi:hypothetical protein